MRLAIAVFLFLGIAPFIGFGAGHHFTLFAHAMIMGIAALGLWLLIGGAGLVSLGHAALLGVGAYAVVVFDHLNIAEMAIVLPAALGAAGLFAAVTGAIALRTTGVNFIMITLAFGQMAFFGASSLAIYGGDDGYTMYGRTRLFGSPWLADRLTFHFACLIALIGAYFAVRVLLASRFGRVLRAARENAARTEAFGFDPYPYRLCAYVVAGLLAGLAGVLLANANEFVAPSYLAWQRSGDLLFMVILGGLGGPEGAVLGALVLILAEEWLSGMTEHWRLILGPLIIAAALFLPRGIIGGWPRG